MHKRAIVRSISNNYKSCISSHPSHHLLDIDKAKIQHKAYINILKELGLDVIILPQLNEFPDSCFVEDTIVIQNRKAMISRFGAESRRGEESEIEVLIKEYYPVMKIKTPGTLEGGDVIHLENYLISGLSQRTNLEGIHQLEDWMGISVKFIQDQTITHLKSYVTYLNRNYVLTTDNYFNHPLLVNFDKLLIPASEAYAANSLTIDDITIIPKGYPKTKQLLKDNGFEVQTLDITEFERCEGALTCLSILF